MRALVPACINLSRLGQGHLGRALIFNQTGQLASPTPASRPIFNAVHQRRRSAAGARKPVVWRLQFTPTPRWTRWTGCLARLATALPSGAAPPHHQAQTLRTLALGVSPISKRARPAAQAGCNFSGVVAPPQRHLPPDARLALIICRTRARPWHACPQPSSRPALKPTWLAVGHLCNSLRPGAAAAMGCATACSGSLCGWRATATPLALLCLLCSFLHCTQPGTCCLARPAAAIDLSGMGSP